MMGLKIYGHVLTYKNWLHALMVVFFAIAVVLFWILVAGF